VRVLLETSDDFIMLGTGELDWSLVTGPPDALVIPWLPEVLRNIAESIESGMTTGPDEETWLQGGDTE
jgi:hypothetical protein